MYVIEITEEKFNDTIESLEKGMKYFGKALECLEEMRESKRYDDDDRSRHRYGGSDNYSDDSRSMNRYGGGRYGRY